MSDTYLKPKVGSPDLIRKKRNGMFINPPAYAEIGGFTNSGKLEREGKTGMALEKGGPKARQGKPI